VRPYIRAAGLLVGLLIAGSCGSSATSPTAAQAPLRDGRYSFTWSGGVACGDVTAPQVGTTATLNMIGTHDGSIWIGRPETAGDGNFEMRLTKSGFVASISGISMLAPVSFAGTISGTGADAFVLPSGGARSGRLIVFGTSTPVSGVADSVGTAGDGRASGAVSFSLNGVSITCPANATSWLMFGPR